MVRDSNKDEAYFSARVAFVDKVIEEDMAVVESFPRLEGRASKSYSLCSACLKSVISRYSRGDSIESIRASVMRWIEAKEMQTRVLNSLPPELNRVRAMYEALTLAPIYDALTMMAFAKALQFSDSDMRRMIAAIGHAGEDAVLDLAATECGDVGRPIASQCKFPTPYAPLQEVWQASPESQEKLLVAYSKRWKQKIKAIYWSNSLKGAEGAYFGYWCFDIAFAAMVFNIDDTALRSSPYYPADLVAFARA